jgi:hypothetical protein
MYWKMSMDLRKPLVRSEGNLDPVDGLVVFRMLQETDRELWGGEAEGREVLRAEIEDYEKIVETKWRGYSSDDPLDLGMTLWTAHHYAQTDQWSEALVKQARRDLAELFGMRYFDAPTRRRLAFREFGTCLGIRCGAELAASEKERELWERRADSITQQWESAGIVPVPDETTRLTSHNSADHLMPITLVMYAAALIPGGEIYLGTTIFSVHADFDFPQLFSTISSTAHRAVINEHASTSEQDDVLPLVN